MSGPKGDKGEPGKDGRGIESVRINNKGELIVRFTDGEEQNVGKVVGAQGDAGKDGQDGKDGADGENGTDGKDGEDGRGIKSVTTNDKGEVVVTYTDGTSEILGTLAGSKGDQGAPGRDGFDGAPGRDGTDGQNGKDGKDGRGIKSVTTDDNGNLVVTYTDGTSETVKSGDKPATPAGGSSVSERCLPTVLGLTIPAALAIPLAFLGNISAQFNIPGLEPVQKQIQTLTYNVTRNIPREAQYAAGGIGLLAALGIIAAACAPTESE